MCVYVCMCMGVFTEVLASIAINCRTYIKDVYSSLHIIYMNQRFALNSGHMRPVFIGPFLHGNVERRRSENKFRFGTIANR